ncbi:MAG: alpha/beta hydrolase, partial [Marinilabiliales bacterium]
VDFLQKEALDVLPELLEKLNLHKKKIILIGHSDGGSIAIMYASKFGENVAGLVVMAPHVLIEDWSLKGIHSAIDAYKNKDLRERLIKYHGENTDSMFNSWVNIWTTEEGHHWNIEDFLPGITAPLLFIQGENDNYGTVVQQNSVINGVSGYAEGLMIPDIGHFPHLESKNLVLDKIHEFIQKQF